MAINLRDSVTVIDGATNGTLTVGAGDYPCTVAANPVTNKIYVVNSWSDNVTVIDGATNGTMTVGAGDCPLAIAVNPVTSKVYVASYNVDNVTVIDETPAHDTKVRAVLGSVPGCTTSLARPPLDGEGTNGSSPYRTAMMGVCNRIGTAQKAWNWAAITSGAGTDSITWEYNWGKDSLVPGENFVCCVPFEDQTATTNNLGLGTPFAGNLEVYPVYRMAPAGGVEESTKPQATSLKPGASIVRGVLLLPQASSHTSQAASLMDATGRRVLDLRPGTNDIRHLAPGVYFVREEPQPPRHEPQTVRKMVIAE